MPAGERSVRAPPRSHCVGTRHCIAAGCQVRHGDATTAHHLQTRQLFRDPLRRLRAEPYLTLGLRLLPTLVAPGLLQTRDPTVSPHRELMQPMALAARTLWCANTAFGRHTAAQPMWLPGLLPGVALSRRLGRRSACAAGPGPDTGASDDGDGVATGRRP
jgi:hypothetical protein